MKKEEMMEMIKKPEISEVIGTFFMGFMEQQKKDTLMRYRHLNKLAKKGQVLFVGSSLMEQFPINELQHTVKGCPIIYNRGIGGYVTADLLSAMEECIFELEPSKIFINIGTNDIGNVGYKKENLITKYDEILTQISQRLPSARVYVMAYYPVNAKVDFPNIDKERKAQMFATRTNSAIHEANLAVKELAENHGFGFINVNEGLSDEEGNLKVEYAIEGLHMWPSAYSVILENMKRYLMD